MLPVGSLGARTDTDRLSAVIKAVDYFENYLVQNRPLDFPGVFPRPFFGNRGYRETL